VVVSNCVQNRLIDETTPRIPSVVVVGPTEVVVEDDVEVDEVDVDEVDVEDDDDPSCRRRWLKVAVCAATQRLESATLRSATAPSRGIASS
jgi:hypothetical protein